MPTRILDAFTDLIGGDADAGQLSVRHMIVRAIIVYAVSIVLVRVGKKRFMGSHTAFDVLMGIIIGSVLSRAINGSARFSESIAAALTLVLLHWLFALLALRFPRFSRAVKGSSRELVRDGEILWDQMRKGGIGKEDLMQALRQRTGTEELERVRFARLERGGEITVILKTAEPRVLDVAVRDGVQVVRVELG